MEEKAKQINNVIINSPLYKRYIFLKKEIENNDCLVRMKEKMELLKKDVCKNKDDLKKNQYYQLEKEYKRNLLVKEYLDVKEELYALLKGITDILSLN